jgi:hypothetical protein
MPAAAVLPSSAVPYHRRPQCLPEDCLAHFRPTNQINVWSTHKYLASTNRAVFSAKQTNEEKRQRNHNKVFFYFPAPGAIAIFVNVDMADLSVSFFSIKHIFLPKGVTQQNWATPTQ